MKKLFVLSMVLSSMFLTNEILAKKNKDKSERETKEYREEIDRGNSENAKENWGQLKDEYKFDSKEEEKEFKEKLKEERSEWQGDNDEKEYPDIEPFEDKETKSKRWWKFWGE